LARLALLHQVLLVAMAEILFLIPQRLMHLRGVLLQQVAAEVVILVLVLLAVQAGAAAEHLALAVQEYQDKEMLDQVPTHQA
jgi:uncharacterized membrane protein